jgi:SAM-dependent methyltransferase
MASQPAHRELAACPLCNRASRCVAQKEKDLLYECTVCQLRFFLPSSEAPEELYGEHYFVGAQSEYLDYMSEEPAHRRQARRYLRRIGHVRRRAGALLDVGCAAGFFLDEARSVGWTVAGLEVSPYASEYARSTLDLPVATGEFPSALKGSEHFDVVTFYNVFEHLGNPGDAVRQLAEIVRPGGIVVIETWDWRSAIAKTLGMGWHQYNARHVPCYYSRHAIEVAFPRPAWEMIRYQVAAKWISARRATEILARQGGQQWLTRLLASPVGGVVRRLDVPYRLGDLVWTVFRRAGAIA